MADSGTADAAEREERRGRLFYAWKALEVREGRNLTLAELGTRIARAEGRAEPYAPSVVRRWFKGMAEPSTVRLWRAIGAVLGVSPALLAFGDDAAAGAAPPSAGGYVAQGRVIPREMYVRAQTQPEDVEAAPPAKRKANGGGKRRG